MQNSLLQKAKLIIESVKGKPLSPEKRADLTIELAAIMLEEARRTQTPQEKKQQKELAGMMVDPIGKPFITTVADRCFRSSSSYRIADQLIYSIQKYGVPKYLPMGKKIALIIFKYIGNFFAPIAVPIMTRMIRKETSNVILPGERKELIRHLNKRRRENVRVNLNHLGEAILGEQEAQHRLQTYLRDLKDPHIEYISVKISTIFSQINLLAWDETLHTLSERLRQLYRTAMENQYLRSDGKKVPKFVNLDMEEYRDLQLTVAAFRKVLDEPEFLHHSAGIVLQSYLPDSFLIQKELTQWAMERFSRGGAPIRLRIVKGANLAMEEVESSLRLWPQAPYATKADVDANFKRMAIYATQKEHAQAVHVGIGSHNLYDIAYALLLRAENDVEHEISFEMLEGMADHMRRVVQKLSGDMLLYCPAATKEEFHNAVAYLVRRLDENTAPENFLRHAFDLMPGTEEWNNQVQIFLNACHSINTISEKPMRTQNRSEENSGALEKLTFTNEPDTDWSLPQNIIWARHILEEWKYKAITNIPLVIGGKMIEGAKTASKEDPSNPGLPYYQYALADSRQINEALKIAQEAQKEWGEISVQERYKLLGQVAQGLRRHRGNLIGAMIADAGKTIPEADVEVSEAIDFAEYYRFNMKEWHSLKDVRWRPKGTVLVTPPWNFPCSIPAGGILAALAAGNCVIIKPAPESVLVAWQLLQIFWEAGISSKVLQFITCEDEPIGSQLIKDPRIAAVVLTGATATAKLFLGMRPGLDLIGETGGKNTMVITAMADRDLAIKDLIQSAFGHSGQKCSACSLAILETEVYDDPHFREQLSDAVSSLAVGSAWDPKTRINPLIREPNPVLMQGLTQLENGEEWLVKPIRKGPNLWSPGVKLGVKPGSFTFENELFGPVLGLVRAKNFSHSLELMNQTRYGLTAGIHTLDEREQEEWLERIEAGNCYINRTITGAIVQRQPFGGCKDSSFGRGAKAGGPNYLTQLMHAEQISLPEEQEEANRELRGLIKSLMIENDEWDASIGSYIYNWRHFFSKRHDPSGILGQENFQAYAPHPQVVFRMQDEDSFIDAFRVLAASITCGTPLEISTDNLELIQILNKLPLPSYVRSQNESEEQFIKRVEKEEIRRVRMLHKPSELLQEALGKATCNLNLGPVLANGRLELLNYLREVSISHDYHRYGYLYKDHWLTSNGAHGLGF